MILFTTAYFHEPRSLTNAFGVGLAVYGAVVYGAGSFSELFAGLAPRNRAEYVDRSVVGLAKAV